MNAVARLNVVVPLCESQAGRFGEDAQNARRTATPHGKREGHIGSDGATHSLAGERTASRDGTTGTVASHHAPRLNAAFIAQVLGQVLPAAADTRRSEAYARPRTFPPRCDITL